MSSRYLAHFIPEEETEKDRTATDSVTTNDTVTRAGNFSRSTTEAPTTSDSVDADSTIARAATDSPTTSDTATRSFTGSRSTADSPSTSDSASRSNAAARSTSDTVTATDSASQVVSGGVVNRTATESVTLSESAEGHRTLFRTVTDGGGEVEYCLDFNTGLPTDPPWEADTLDVVSGELHLGPASFGSLIYDGPSPQTPTELSFKFRAPNPIDDDYWSIEVDSYGQYVFIDNWYSTLGTSFGLYVLTDTFEIPFSLIAGDYYQVKASFNWSTGYSAAKIWADGDPEPPGWDIEATAAPSTWEWGIWAEVNGAGDLFFDDVCWTYTGVAADEVNRTLVATRSLTEDLETDEWILNGGTVDTPVYGQDPNGYQPELAAPIDDTQTTITVTQPLPPGTQLPILVYINGEYMLVTAVSLDGLTWTVVRGYNGSSAASHGTGSILPANTTMSVGGVQVGAFVDFNRSRLATYANGNVGTGEIWVRDVDRVMSFTTGAEVVVRHRNVRVWGGYIANIKRAYAFPGGSGDPDDEARYLVLEVVDYNILLRKRVYYDLDDPTHMKVKTWPNGTHDSLVIGYMLHNSLDLQNDGLSFDIHHVGTPGLPTDSCNPDAPDRFQIAWAGYTWQDAMRAIAEQTGAIYYIDPDKVFRYVDDSTKQSAFGYTGLSDDPSGSVIGYRDFELSKDGTKLVNEQFTWGAGQGSPLMVLGHEQDMDSIDEHGLWQQAELRFDMYCQETVDLRAETWLNGSPQNRRGYKEDHIAARATVFTPYFRVADVITLESTTFGFDDVIPVRGMEITFPTPWDIQCVMTISHEYDSPWEAFEFAFPAFDFRFNPPLIDFDGDPWGPYDPCAADGSDSGCISETFTRTVAEGPGESEAPGGEWTESPYFTVDGDELVVERPPGTPAPNYTTLINTQNLPFEILISAHWERDFDAEPGPPHGPGSAEAYGWLYFMLWSQSGEGGSAPFQLPWERLGIRLNRDSDTLEDYVSIDVAGDGPGPSDSYSIGGVVPNLISASTQFKIRWRVEEEAVRLKVWEASAAEPASWSQELSKDFLASGYNAWAMYAPLSNESPASIGFVEGVRLYIDYYLIGDDCTEDDPCFGVPVGSLEDPIGDGTLYGVPPVGGVQLGNGNYLYTFGVQFLPGSTEVWADGLRLRLTEDYDEHPENGAIEIHADAQSGFTVFDPGMTITANLTPFVTHDPPPEYVEP